MTLPDRNNPYQFDDFLALRNEMNIFKDDTFLQQAIRTYAGDLGSEMEDNLAAFSEKVSFRWKQLADQSGRPENAPSMLHYDAFNNRIDRIQRPASTLQMEQEIWGEGIFRSDVSSWEAFLKIFMLCYLGEAGINCAHCCTGGLVKILEQFADTEETQAILSHLKEGKSGEFAIGAQFLTEIQGGSDVQANQVEAVKSDDGWKVYGTKYYCSAAHADYAIVTAKPSDSHDVGIFLIPSWLSGDKEKEKRNGFTINKLKSKLGTCELPTAEITYQGAVAYPLGDLKRGLSNIVGIVLAHSRFVCGLSSASQISRIAQETQLYANWRTAFGVTIKDFGLVALQLQQLELHAKRSVAGALKLQSEIIALQESSEDMGDMEKKQREFHVRILIMLQKLVGCTDSAAITETAMSIFGANGLMEDFSSLPRMYRDAVVISGAWEGPRNLLLTRIFMDLQKAQSWYKPSELLGNLLHTGGSAQASTTELASALEDVLAHESLLSTTPETLDVCERWDRLCSDIMHRYQEAAIVEVESFNR